MNKRLVIVCLLFVSGTGGYAVAQRGGGGGGGGRQSPMAKLMNDLQQATPRATLSDDQNDNFKQISPHSKMRNRLDAKGNRLIKTRCNQLSMRSMELWIVAHSSNLIRSNWTRTSLRFNLLSSSASSFYSELAMRVRGQPVAHGQGLLARKLGAD
jgi:hypothetical protein